MGSLLAKPDTNDASPQAVLRSLSSYATCVQKSEEVSWDLDEAVRGIHLDFDREFLPEAMAQTRKLEFLTEAERRRLNQVQAHSYAHLFQFVEDIIIAQILIQARHHVHTDHAALRALLRFCEEEVKHQQLFAAFKSVFVEEFPVPCGSVEDAGTLADQLSECNDLAIMLMISMLEWITQKHYMSCFRDDNEQLDRGYSRLFELHWAEEAQHARLDSLEIDRIARNSRRADIERGVEGFLKLCDLLDEVLQDQAWLDLETLEKLLGRSLDTKQRKAVLETRFRSYRWMFIGCGLEHPVFRRIIEDLAPGQMGAIDALNARLA